VKTSKLSESMGWDNAVSIVPRYRLDGPGIEPRWGGGGEIFRNLPDWFWGLPSLLYNGYWVFPRGKVRPRHGIDHPTPSSAEVKERVKLYTTLPLIPLWAFVACSRVNFTLLLLPQNP